MIISDGVIRERFSAELSKGLLAVRGESHVDVGCKCVLADGTAGREVLRQKWRWWMPETSVRHEWLKQNE